MLFNIVICNFLHVHLFLPPHPPSLLQLLAEVFLCHLHATTPCDLHSKPTSGVNPSCCSKPVAKKQTPALLTVAPSATRHNYVQQYGPASWSNLFHLGVTRAQFPPEISLRIVTHNSVISPTARISFISDILVPAREPLTSSSQEPVPPLCFPVSHPHRPPYTNTAPEPTITALGDRRVIASSVKPYAQP